MTISTRLAALSILGSQLLLGSAVHAQNAQAVPSKFSETYGSWTVNCLSQEVASGQLPKRHCEMVQEHFQNENGQRVLAFSVRTNDDTATITFLTPFGLQLTAGIEVSSSNQPLFKSKFSTCLPSGCIAVASVPLNVIEALTSKSEVGVKMVSMDNQGIVVTAPLDGFSNALSRLKTI